MLGSKKLRDYLIVRLTQGRLPGWVAPWVQARIQNDLEWSSIYDALRKAERAAQDGAPLSNQQLTFLEGAILEQTKPVQISHPLLRPLLVAGVAAAAVLLVVLGLPELYKPNPPINSDGWQSRGTDSGNLHRVGMRITCLTKGGTALFDQTEVGSRVALSELHCPAGGLLAFEVTHLSSTPQEVFVIGVNPQNQLRWYAPFVRGGRSISVRPGEVGRPLDVLADLSQLPQEQRVTLYVLFRGSPIAGDEIEQSTLRQHLPLASLDRFPIDTVFQARVDLILAAEPKSP